MDCVGGMSGEKLIAACLLLHSWRKTERRAPKLGFGAQTRVVGEVLESPPSTRARLIGGCD